MAILYETVGTPTAVEDNVVGEVLGKGTICVLF